MKTKASNLGYEAEFSSVSHDEYEGELHLLQIELVKLQKHFLCCNDRILVIFEGRDASGKDGTIKRIVEHLSPRETRVVALGKPSDRDRSSWYFQRFAAELPAAGEFLLLGLKSEVQRLPRGNVLRWERTTNT